MKECVYCGVNFGDPPEFCRACWYDGTVLADNMSTVIEILTKATDTVWYAEHTGGNCFWLCTRPDGGDRYEGMRDENAGHPVPLICVTDEDGPLAGTDTVRDVERHGGWCVGAYPDYWAGGTEDDTCWYCSTEELPMKVREAQTWLKEYYANA